MPTVQELIELTPEQRKAWKRLEKAIKDFKQAGGAFYSVLDTLNAYNGNNVAFIDETGEHFTGNVLFESIDSPGLTSFADDWHGITFKPGVVPEDE
jgi:hypothetical protein